MKRAMIFAAGLGTRLRPLTNDRPKAMVKLNGRTLLETNIRKLVSFGFSQIVVNVHHYADMIKDFLGSKDFGAEIFISDESDMVLETGGGLLKAAPFLMDGGSFLAHNVDILSNLDLNSLYEAHLRSNALATLAVRKRNTSRYLLFDDQRILHGWVNVKAGIVRQRRATDADLHFHAFSGIHVINPEIFGLFKRKGKFSIIDTYLDCAKTHPIQAYPHDEGLWLDVGKPKSLEQAKNLFG